MKIKKRKKRRFLTPPTNCSPQKASTPPPSPISWKKRRLPREPFKDKYDVKNKLIVHKTNELFTAAGAALEESGITGLEDELIFIINHIIDILVENKPLLNFISKNLVMGALRSALLTGESSDREFYDKFLQLVEQDAYSYADVDVMLFTIVELAGSAGYNSILYNEPLPIETYKPFLYRSVRLIIQSHRAG